MGCRPSFLNRGCRSIVSEPASRSTLPAGRTAFSLGPPSIKLCLRRDRHCRCWIDWHTERLTAHDGLVRRNHPLVVAALARRQSATSLARLLRDPLGYLWAYGFGWQQPQESEEPLLLDALAFGNLLHAVLQKAVDHLETARPGGLGIADAAAISAALDTTLDAVAAEWERSAPVPPPVIWRRKLHEIRALALAALTFPEDRLPDQRSWAEIPFGGDARAEALSPELRARLPWDALTPVVIPGTDIAIGGSIDRLELSGAGSSARVTDYKSGRPPGRRKEPVLKGGAELQRCLYAYAVSTLVTGVNDVEARLLYPKGADGGLYRLLDPGDVLARLAGFIRAAQRHSLAGNLLARCRRRGRLQRSRLRAPGWRQGKLLRAEEPAHCRTSGRFGPALGV